MTDTRKYIEEQFDQFFEFDTDDRSTVTSASCRFFAEHCIEQLLAVIAKKLVMRFVGSQVTMEPKRLSEEEVAEIMDNNGAGWWTKHNHEFDYHGFANALMDKMTGGGE